MEEWGVEIGYHMAALAKRLHWYMMCKYPEEEEWVDSPELFEGYPPDFPVRFDIHVAGHDWFLYAVGNDICEFANDGWHTHRKYAQPAGGVSAPQCVERDWTLHRRDVLPLGVTLLQRRLAHNAMKMARVARSHESPHLAW